MQKCVKYIYIEVLIRLATNEISVENMTCSILKYI